MTATPDAAPTWIDCALTQLDDPRKQAALGAILGAFAGPFPRGGPPPPPEMPWRQSFAQLAAHAEQHYEPRALVDALSEEVDFAQAKLFVRRLNSVIELLGGLCGPNQPAQLAPNARVLQVGLWHRAHQIGQTQTPKALRIRALADFYYSQAATLVHAQASQHAPSLAQIMQGLEYQEVSPGISHAHYAGPCPVGPINFNLLRVRIDQVKISATNCRDQLRCNQPFASWASPLCDAAISGGFFLYSEADITPPSARRDPVGLLVCDGEVHNPPTFGRAAFVQDRSGKVELRPVLPDEQSWCHQGKPLALAGYINRATAKQGPDQPSLALVGQKVIAVGRNLEVPLNGIVLLLDPAQDASAIQVGDELAWNSPWHQAMAGGPMLLCKGEPCLDLRAEEFWGSAPPVTFSQDETGDTNLLARLALGLTQDQTLYALAVDGRNFDQSLGMTLRGMGQMMQALGCESAANMDGGSSKRMLVNGETVDLHSTEIISQGKESQKMRPVHSALLFQSKLR